MTVPAAYCRTCDYDLTGLPDKHRCPECGRGFDRADPRSFRKRPRRGIWRKLRWVVYPLLFILLAGAGGIGWTWWEWKREQPVIAWARTHESYEGGGVSKKPIGPVWLRSRAGRWGYLLDRTHALDIRAHRPVMATDLSLSRLRQLRKLHLYGWGIGDELMGEVGRVRELRELTLWDTVVTDIGLSGVAACRRLQVLCLGYCKVGDKGLAPLANHPELTFLEIIDTPVDDMAVPVLKGLTRLERLELRGTKITPEGLAELKKALPNCQIIGP